MSLRKARKILSVLFVIIMAVGGNLFFSSEIVKYTICNPSYMVKVFSLNSFYTQCEKNFTDRIEVISAKSKIPADVFKAVLDEDAVLSSNAVKKLFTDDNPELYSPDLIEQFENLCLEYLDGNKISYDKTMVHNTAVYAAEVYSDSFGIHNTQEAKAFIDNVNGNYAQYASIGLLLIVVSSAIFFIIYSKKNERKRAFASAFTALGGSLFLPGFCGLVFGVADSPMLTPQQYAKALSVAVDGAFVLLMTAGILITVLSVTASVHEYKKSNNQ